MKNTTATFLQLLKKLNSGFLNSYYLLREYAIKNGKDVDDCFYARSAESRFYSDGEYQEILLICLKILVNAKETFSRTFSSEKTSLAENRFYSEDEYQDLVTICRKIIEEEETREMTNYLNEHHKKRK